MGDFIYMFVCILLLYVCVCVIYKCFSVCNYTLIALILKLSYMQYASFRESVSVGYNKNLISLISKLNIHFCPIFIFNP